MKVLYVGQYQSGSTSRMRGEKLKKALNTDEFDVINTFLPFSEINRLFRSIGFRYKFGPLISKINTFVLEGVVKNYDLIWVDKGVYLQKETTLALRRSTKRLVHFTPDPAFFFHQSMHFIASIPLYDFVVTTKTFEVANYEKLVNAEKVILVTQGYDKEVHFPVVEFSKKEKGVVFVGHHEKEREELLSFLIEQEVQVALAGIKWEKFAAKYQHNTNLKYLGQGLYQEEYVKALSSYHFGLGLLSKWIPEKHTTRTFEIPACGTALLTEPNEEISGIFNEDEAVFFENASDLVKQVKYFLSNLGEMEKLTEKGYARVRSGYDYETILTKIVKQIGL